MAALMVTGISFPENVFAVSAGMDGLPSVVNSGIGKMVDKSSTIDGTYNFTPVIGANTKIRFGCSDGSGSWDNKFCLNAEQHAHACSQWWPLSNINDGGNTRSFIPYERLKGKMYAEYTNVGNANGLPVTMRIWFLDWQNTDISGYPGYEDVDNVVVSVDNTKGGATPVIDIKGLKWIKVRFSYYDENGNPLKVKGHFTLSDLDYSQGFYIDGKVDGIALYEQNAATSKDKFHMQVGSGVYDTRKDAGNAIIKFFQTDADGTAKIGTYLGFSMNIAFDSFNRKFVLRLKGAMNHPVEIGPDPVGNIIRLDNVLKTMPDKLAEAKDRLETLTNQLESAKIEVTKPFQQEEELAEKLKRLAELNALLNMDEKGTDALILEDDEQPAIVNSDMAVTPITSVKTKPMLKKKVVGLCL